MAFTKRVLSITHNNNLNRVNNTNSDFLCLFSSVCHVWHGKFLHQKYKHCLIITKSKNGWTYINPLRSELRRVKFENVELDNLVNVYADLGYEVLVGTRLRETVKRSLRRQTCVDVCKRIIGVSMPYVATPKQLRDYLVRKEIAFQYQPEICAK